MVTNAGLRGILLENGQVQGRSLNEGMRMLAGPFIGLAYILSLPIIFYALSVKFLARHTVRLTRRMR